MQPRQSYVYNYKDLCSSLGLIDQFIVNVSSLVCKVKKLKGAYCIEKSYIIIVDVDVKWIKYQVAQNYELYDKTENISSFVF